MMKIHKKVLNIYAYFIFASLLIAEQTVADSLIGTLETPWARYNLVEYDDVIDDEIARILQERDLTVPANKSTWWWPGSQNEFPTSENSAMQEMVDWLCDLDREVFVFVKWRQFSETPPFPRKYAIISIPDKSRSKLNPGCEYSDLKIRYVDEKIHDQVFSGGKLDLVLPKYFGVERTEEAWVEASFRRDDDNRIKSVHVVGFRKMFPVSTSETECVDCVRE